MPRSSLFLSSLLMLTALYSNISSAQMSMLHSQGRSIVNAQGQVVPLQGVNLGGWFVMEKWMAPLTSDSLPDTYSVMQKLDQRFGVETEQSLIKTYQPPKHRCSITDRQDRNVGWGFRRLFGARLMAIVVR